MSGSLHGHRLVNNDVVVGPILNIIKCLSERRSSGGKENDREWKEGDQSDAGLFHPRLNYRDTHRLKDSHLTSEDGQVCAGIKAFNRMY